MSAKKSGRGHVGAGSRNWPAGSWTLPACRFKEHIKDTPEPIHAAKLKNASVPDFVTVHGVLYRAHIARHTRNRAFSLTAGGKTGYFEVKLRGEFFFKKVLCKWLNRYRQVCLSVSGRGTWPPHQVCPGDNLVSTDAGRFGRIAIQGESARPRHDRA